MVLYLRIFVSVMCGVAHECLSSTHPIVVLQRTVQYWTYYLKQKNYEHTKYYCTVCDE